MITQEGADCPSDQRKAAGTRPTVLVGRALAAVAWLASVASAAAFLGMTALVIVQVVFRYMLNTPLIGSEEGARIAMIYVVLIGSALCLRRHGHMAVTYFRDRLPAGLAMVADAIIAVGIAIFSMILVLKGAELAQRSMFMTTPALQIPRGYVVWAFPICGVLMLLFLAEIWLRRMLGQGISPVEELDT